MNMTERVWHSVENENNTATHVVRIRVGVIDVDRNFKQLITRLAGGNLNSINDQTGETPNLKHLRRVSKIILISLVLGLWWKAKNLNHLATHIRLFWFECQYDQIYFLNLFRYLLDNFSQLVFLPLKIYKGKPNVVMFFWKNGFPH